MSNFKIVTIVFKIVTIGTPKGINQSIIIRNFDKI